MHRNNYYLAYIIIILYYIHIPLPTYIQVDRHVSRYWTE